MILPAWKYNHGVFGSLFLLLAGSSFPVVFGQQAFPEPDAGRGHLHEFVVLDVLQGYLQAHDARRPDPRGIILSNRTKIGELFLFRQVDGDIFVLRVFAYNLAFVNRLARIHEENSPVVESVKGVRSRLAGLH